MRECSLVQSHIGKDSHASLGSITIVFGRGLDVQILYNSIGKKLVRADNIITQTITRLFGVFSSF